MIWLFWLLIFLSLCVDCHAITTPTLDMQVPENTIQMFNAPSPL